jgi:SSS family solute:Na+ symporter|nr:sodium/solute symporter [Candidatus Krumholzibacteria bacterium]
MYRLLIDIDVLIILAYFVTVMTVGVLSRQRGPATADEFFLSGRSLGWKAIALSTVATNIHAGHFLGMAGSAYLYGLAQANLEINAVFGILMATFVFVPLYLRLKVTTISQFFADRFGPRVALAYSVLTMVLYGFLYLGTTLFWGAYAVNALFPEQVAHIHADPATRVLIMMAVLGAFSATYTYLGGLRAVVRTDAIQFTLLVGGGFALLFLALQKLGGWSQLYQQTDLMHLHLPADHPKLPWTAIGAMLLLNLNYWGSNQIILQRALAAKSVREAQIGLLASGVLKYVMALIIVVPAIALAGILKDNALADPDRAYPTLVNMLLPKGLRGLVLCGLFASLMSSVDSIFNSVSTLWSVDIFRGHLRPEATDAQVVAAGRRAILVTLVAGMVFGGVQVYIKFTNPEFALTHWFNDTSYYIKVGFVILIASAVFLLRARPGLVLAMMLLAIPWKLALERLLPGVAYFNITALTILSGLAVVAAESLWRERKLPALKEIFYSSDNQVILYGALLLASLVGLQVAFH